MSDFSAQWLALREPLDAQSRDTGLAESLNESLAAMPPRDAPFEIIDLGAGTGANLRYAAPRLGGVQNWLLVERDPRLLDAVAGCMETWAQETDTQMSSSGGSLALRAEQFDCRVRNVALDLTTQLDQVPLPRAGLLTATALLDLVSEQWLRGLIRDATDAAMVLWFALTYDGRMSCHPVEPEDEEVRELFNRHQLRDKGFGPALGPAAGRMAIQILVEQGYRVQSAHSDWYARPQHPHLQRALVAGWFEAAREMAPQRATGLQSWMKRRCAHIDAGRSALVVGHLDLIATLKNHVNA
ncbi:MAG TPA: hypothetical protein VGV09_10235 [Steroidobacteraceae bacterium]|nr:hypothetical protein [Steroidobacteraceae bacterium]